MSKPKRRKKKTYTKHGIYRSGLEKSLAKGLPKDFEYEPCQIPYIINKKYCPDFVYKHFLIECKGFFRAGDTQKYKAIRDYLTNHELIFVLSNPRTRVRKGAKLTMSQWCEKEGLKHFTVDQTQELLHYIKEQENG